ncbi:MAG: 50S ribosomal protein L4 [Christensenellales bacterium]|uniref:Large ribosomal subunit protein uL4 n=1 Tax=Candidatus Avichristensenella intestinipullorum TaxID=2840693 RepID=A0A9D0YVF6_9FIRM|nr:50S ribosomal protein L4 [Christensenellales bacterium]HIQ62439.1 50S ribosomal protein L4 [Candidatus Avichristensenella intestinipullorum]
MPTVNLKNTQGATVGQIELSDAIFAAEVNPFAMHLVVRAILNGRRLGTQSALTRTEVRGGGRKIYRQKGTGNARHHGNRAPQFKKGGVVFAPKPRDYDISVPKKVRRLAMKSAFTSKAQADEIIVLDKLALDAPKTREMVKVLRALGATKKALVLVAEKDEQLLRASRNIPGVTIALINTLNVYEILRHDAFILTQDAVRQVEEVYA